MAQIFGQQNKRNWAGLTYCWRGVYVASRWCRRGGEVDADRVNGKDSAVSAALRCLATALRWSPAMERTRKGLSLRR